MDIPDQNSSGPHSQTSRRWRTLFADKGLLILTAIVFSAALGGINWMLNSALKRSGISGSTVTILFLLALWIHSQFRIRQLESKLKELRVGPPKSGTR